MENCSYLYVFWNHTETIALSVLMLTFTEQCRGCNQLTKSHTFILGVWVEGKCLFTSYFYPLPLFFAIPRWFEFIFPSFSWLEIHKSAFSAFCEIFWYAWIQKKIRKIVTPARSRDHVARKTENMKPEKTKSCFLKYEYRLTHTFPMHPFSIPRKQKTFRFSDVFRGYRNGALGTNGK